MLAATRHHWRDTSASRRALMKTALIFAILSLITCLPAHAYETEIGAVTICDTQRPAERYIQVFDGNPRTAIRAVNIEENDPNACALADVSYVQGRHFGMTRSSSHAFRIVSIVGVGVRCHRFSTSFV